VAVDGSAAANKGLREAVRLAGIEGGQLFILYVVNEFYAYASMEGVGLGTDVSTVLRKEGQRLLERAKAVAAKQGVQAKIVQREILGGSAADSIVKEAKKLRADIIVLGTHGRRGVRRLVMGSDAEQVVRTASVPVLLLR
jgi:nucleotide-binding universal stress UspA family protein